MEGKCMICGIWKMLLIGGVSEQTRTICADCGRKITNDYANLGESEQ